MKIKLDVLKMPKGNDDEIFKMCRSICRKITLREDKFDNSLEQIFYGHNLDYLVTATEVKTKELVGGMGINIENLNENKSVYIAATCVSPDYQRCGISSAMFNYLEQHAKNLKSFKSYINKQNTSSIESRIKMGFEMTDHPALNNQFYIATKPVNSDKAQKTLDEIKPQIVEVKEPLSKQKARDEREPL
jgi:GNAT superfamily N-acetyltransferase